MSHTIYAAKFEQTIIHQHVHLRRESQSHIHLRRESQSHIHLRRESQSHIYLRFEVDFLHNKRSLSDARSKSFSFASVATATQIILATLPLYSQNATWRSSIANTVNVYVTDFPVVNVY
jgi:hypothetical protein